MLQGYDDRLVSPVGLCCRVAALLYRIRQRSCTCIQCRSEVKFAVHQVAKRSLLQLQTAGSCCCIFGVGSCIVVVLLWMKMRQRRDECAVGRKEYACMVEVCCILGVHEHRHVVTMVSCKPVTMRSIEEAELALTGWSASLAARGWSWP
jgi:hypothetical protein